MICPACGHDNPPQFAFCPRCGARLGPPRIDLDALGERKLVTLVCADVAGFTPLAERYDAEETALIVNRVFAALAAEVVRYDGALDRYAGDALVARFGAPLAQENHAELGVRAALALQAALTRVNADLAREHNVQLSLRVGVNTGEVLAAQIGGAGVRRYTVTGAAVTLAARLEQAGRTGAVLVGPETWRRTQAIFDYDGPLTLQPRQGAHGTDNTPLTAYLARGVKRTRQPVRGLPGLHAPLIGRAHELARLHAAIAQAQSTTRPVLIAVLGEPGLGKSRLRREFTAWLAAAHAQARTLTIRCLPHLSSVPDTLPAACARAALDLAEDTAPDEQGARLRTHFAAWDPDEQRFALAALLTLLDLPPEPIAAEALAGVDPAQRRLLMLQTVTRLLQDLPPANPFVLFIEDLHWADETSRDFLDHLLQAYHGAPLLLVLSTRPEPERIPQRAYERQLARDARARIELHELTADESRTLIQELLRQLALGAELVERLIAQAQGNPFFVEELLRDLIESGVLVQSDGNWRAVQSVTSLPAPATVQDVLGARIDRLPVEEKLVLTRAAVAGRTFPPALIAHLADGPVERALHGLEEKGLLQRLVAPTDPADDEAYTFRHALVQDVAYGLLPRQARQILHRRAGEWLETLSTAGALHSLASLERLAFHFSQSDARAKAASYLLLAAQRAERAYANDAALRHLALLVETLTSEGPTPALAEALDLRLELLGRVGDYAHFAHDATALAACAHALGDARWDARAGLRIAERYTHQRDPAAEPAATAAAEAARAAGDRALEARALKQIGMGRFLGGDLRAALAPLEAALVIQVAVGDEREESATRHLLGYLNTTLGDYALAREHLDRALAIQRARGYLSGEGFSLSNLGILEMILGNYTASVRAHQTALSVRRRTGEQRRVLVSLVNLLQAYSEMGVWPEVQATAETVRALAQQYNAPQFDALACLALGQAALAAGQADEACVHFDAADAYYAAHDPDGDGHRELRAERARAQLARGALTAALADSAAAVTPPPALDGDLTRPQALWLVRYHVLRAAGDPAAGAALAAARALVHAQAARVRDLDQRRVFLSAVRVNRDILG